MTRPVNTNYFEIIDTKDKAYFLGLLFSDGNVYGRRVTFSFSMHDNWFVDKISRVFEIGKFRERYDKHCEIRINSTGMINDLAHHGCVPRKTKIIELPKLDSRELYLAFLLGFFDGDGSQGKTLITCGSKKFLEGIKEMFQLPFKICQDTRKSGCFSLSLGVALFNDMLDNYQDSLPRKRYCFCTKEEKIQRLKIASVETCGREWAKNGHKLTISREDLEQLVWRKPSRNIARDLGVSDSAITKRCKKLGIEKPGRGYWAKQSLFLARFVFSDF